MRLCTPDDKLERALRYIYKRLAQLPYHPFKTIQIGYIQKDNEYDISLVLKEFTVINNNKIRAICESIRNHLSAYYSMRITFYTWDLPPGHYQRYIFGNIDSIDFPRN